jgi:hypothetical protein
MALRSPVLFHNFWGTANAAGVPWVSGQLPNEGAPPTNTSPNVQIGDFAYVATPAPPPDVGTFYVCTNAGDPVLGGAVWVALSTGGGSGLDRIAPKYLVGNVLAGDSAVAYSTDGFVYIPDIGDGAGIALALSYADPNSLAFVAAGDVWIRPGTYDFGQGGSPSMPLTIPAGTRVQGAGNTTRLRAKTAGDQGVFVMAAGGAGTDSALSSLRDLSILVGQVADPTGSLSAVLVRAGGVAITGVNFDINTTALSVLRHAILVDTGGANVLPVTSIETVSIFMTVVGYATTPVLTSGIRVIEGQVAARNVTTIGGDIGVEITNNNTDPQSDSGAALFFGSQMEISNPSQYAVLTQQAQGAVNAAAVRISESVFFTDFAPLNPPPRGAGTTVGAKLEASFVSTFRSVVTVGFSTGYDVVRPVGGDFVSAQIDDCGIFLCDLGVRFGAGASGCSVSDTEIGTDLPFPPNPLTVSANKGVRIENNASNISVTNNIIRVADWFGTGATAYGVYCNGQSDNLFIEGNEIDHAASPGTFATITVLDSTDVAVADNHVNSESSVGAIVITDSAVGAITTRVTVTGNTIILPNPAFPTVGIEVSAAKRVTITGNAIDHSAYTAAAPSAAAVRIVQGSDGLPNRCTVTGNTIQPSTAGAAPAIAIDGDENTCANNVCSLDAPPLTAAIAVSGANNVVLGNVCRTVPPVTNTGGPTNEIAHNI